MKKIKFLMMAAVALVTAMSFTACSDDDDNSSNYQKYQQEVTNMVNKQKKNDKVILIVAFGSTWQQAYDTFETTRLTSQVGTFSSPFLPSSASTMPVKVRM